ncbi:MAG: HAMP domain-containing protein, partial [Planctomycetota bacterium]|nr:HAMP domain-containing protein [Planctomycetota bacterium]
MAAGTKSSLSRRFSFALIAVVFLILLAFSTFAILFNVHQNKTELDTRAKNLAGFASVSVAQAVWNLDNEAISQVGDALALNDSFAFVNILSEDEVILTKIDEGEILKSFEEFSKSTNHTATSADVSHDGEKIGRLNLALSRKALQKQLISEVTGIIALLAIIVAAISFTSLTITRRYIFQPLSELETSATVIADGNLDEPVTFESDDEIGVLAQAFDGMRGSLKQRLQDLD